MTKTSLSFSERSNEPRWLRERRKTAFEQLHQLPPPLSQYGLGIMIDPSLLQFDHPSLEARHSWKGYVHHGVSVLPWTEALQEHPELLEQYMFHSLPDDWHSMFHTAFCHNGAFVYVPSGVHIDLPVSLMFPIDSPSVLTHVVLIAEAGSHVKIVDAPHCHARLRQYSRAIEVVVKEGADVTYVAGHQYPSASRVVSTMAALIEKDGHLEWIDCYRGGQYTLSRTITFLQHPGASVQQKQAFIGCENHCLDLHSQVIHQASHTKSMMVSKGVLTDKAKAITRGLIKILPDAGQSQGYQEQHALLLSEAAEIDPVPMLEIHHDEVKCKHSTTVTQIDEEQLYYAMSRGLDESAAKREIVKGFLGGILDALPEQYTQHPLREALLQPLQEAVS